MKANEMRTKVVERLVELMAQGERPWHRGWDARNMGVPTSVSSGKPYRGVNVIWLDMVAMGLGYESKWWGTFDAWRAKGHCVNKGERAQWAFYWGTARPKKGDEDKKKDSYRFMKTYCLFSAHQVKNLADDGPAVDYLPSPEKAENYETSYAAFDEMVARSGIKITHGGDKAAYRPMSGSIVMPKRGLFDSAEEYYGVLAHELCHAADARVNRKTWGKYGDEGYAFGELVAEIGSSYMLRELGIPVVKCEYMEINKSAYLADWMKAIEGNEKAIWDAAATASKAVDFLMGRVEAFAEVA